mgnify:CR=1 FL=1
MKKINWKKELIFFLGLFIFLVAIEQILLINKLPFSMNAILLFAFKTFCKLSIFFIIRLCYLQYFDTSKSKT